MIECSCPECVSACRNDPGRLVPADVQRIADFLSISTETLLNEYLVKIQTPAQGVFALAPAKRRGKKFIAEPGTTAPKHYAGNMGECIFLNDEGLCDVHSVKPFECGAYMGCAHTFLGRPYKDKDVEDYFCRKWKSYPHKKES